MSVILFFGFSLLVLGAGFTLVALSVAHHWKIYRNRTLLTESAAPTTTPEETSQAPQ